MQIASISASAKTPELTRLHAEAHAQAQTMATLESRLVMEVAEQSAIGIAQVHTDMNRLKRAMRRTELAIDALVFADFALTAPACNTNRASHYSQAYA